jgi:hypothetical protein
MPFFASTDATEATAFAPAAECGSADFAPEVAPRSLLLLASIDAVSGGVVQRYSAAVGAPYGKAAVMATASSLYLASYNSEWACPSSCGGWWCDIPPEPCTFAELSVILAFDVDGSSGLLALRAQGGVPGYLLSQWAMSEHDGHLRVAWTRSTCGGWWEGGGPCTDNLVDVLRASDLQLASDASRLSGLGLGETIYAVRFEGPVGFVVTFRQVDPLFTLDLSDPLAPSVLGELKITGYSDYLHLLDPDTLLGIGREATEEGILMGVKLALFDVSNMTQPTEVRHSTPRGTRLLACCALTCNSVGALPRPCLQPAVRARPRPSSI